MESFVEFRQKVHAVKQDRMAGDRLYALVRAVSVRLSYALVALFPGIKPNHVSVCSVALLLIVLAANSLYGLVPGFALVIIQLLLVQLAALGDRVDGEVARYKSYFTQRGIYYDRVFHFFFPFALYISVGHFFASETGFTQIVIAAVILAVVAALSSSLGKLRHHIIYKIKLEGHGKMIRDPKPVVGKAQIDIVGRLGRYAIFMMYDWVWAIYLILVLLAIYRPLVAFYLYLLHSGASLIVLLGYILITYPSRSLFSREDLES